MRVNFELRGLERTLRRLNQLPQEVQDRAKTVIATTTINIEGDAIARTPVQTGNLKSGWNTFFENNGLTGIVSNSVSYAIHVEMGTRKMRSQSMLFPAFEANKRSYEADMRAALRGIR